MKYAWEFEKPFVAFFMRLKGLMHFSTNLQHLMGLQHLTRLLHLIDLLVKALPTDGSTDRQQSRQILREDEQQLSLILICSYFFCILVRNHSYTSLANIKKNMDTNGYPSRVRVGKSSGGDGH